jgi:hypothetical protein
MPPTPIHAAAWPVATDGRLSAAIVAETSPDPSRLA